ncbi:MaoC family dehydratase [Ramlibacter sp. AW1]|uniref:MaoC family dehydratase n=1 Tax=Ramlibacter aurantiacus TaxID=2801330 RepID=A0A937D6J8_9BURK|nr:MaoC family dehydratase [Ramlibacter aurantiacus]MBL0419916.1 MaoC family dehydratase [Ramlibacter aurantiacus]
MAPRFFEDFTIGETWVSPPTQVTAEEIVAFARDFDPQPMHTDAQQAARGPFKALVASGWHIAALAMRVFVQSGGYGSTPMVGLGIDELRWRAPVRAGDTLTVRREVFELRASQTSPSHGIVRTRVSVINQDGAVVMTLISAGRVPTRAGRATDPEPA